MAACSKPAHRANRVFVLGLALSNLSCTFGQRKQGHQSSAVEELMRILQSNTDGQCQNDIGAHDNLWRDEFSTIVMTSATTEILVNGWQRGWDVLKLEETLVDGNGYYKANYARRFPDFSILPSDVKDVFDDYACRDYDLYNNDLRAYCNIRNRSNFGVPQELKIPFVQFNDNKKARIISRMCKEVADSLDDTVDRLAEYYFEMDLLSELSDEPALGETDEQGDDGDEDQGNEDEDLVDLEEDNGGGDQGNEEEDIIGLEEDKDVKGGGGSENENKEGSEMLQDDKEEDGEVSQEGNNDGPVRDEGTLSSTLSESGSNESNKKKAVVGALFGIGGFMCLAGLGAVFYRRRNKAKATSPEPENEPEQGKEPEEEPVLKSRDVQTIEGVSSDMGDKVEVVIEKSTDEDDDSFAGNSAGSADVSRPSEVHNAAKPRYNCDLDDMCCSK